MRIAALVLLALIVCAPPAHASISSETLRVGDVVRTFELTTTWSAPRAIVIALHPRPATGAAMRHISGLDARAEDGRFIVAYPDAAGGA